MTLLFTPAGVCYNCLNLCHDICGYHDCRCKEQKHKQWWFGDKIKLPLTKIISGGQTGADRAGLIAAKALKLETGGWMPNGWFAQDGKHPHFAHLYGMQEHIVPRYPPRTAQNVADSDATIRFAGNWESPGEVLTLKAIKQKKKIHFDVDVRSPQEPTNTLWWIILNNIKVLNVAGNSENTWPGTQDFVIKYLTDMMEHARKEKYI